MINVRKELNFVQVYALLIESEEKMEMNRTANCAINFCFRNTSIVSFVIYL